MIRIIHFSDAHFQPGDNIMRYQNLADKFIASLKVIHKEHPIDLIIFSGDMVDRGGQGFTSIDDAFMNFKNLIIDKILNALQLSQERFVFVCGNHDVDRSADNKYQESGLLSNLIDITSLDDFVRDPDSVSNVKRITAFNKFRHDFYTAAANVEFHETNYQSNLVLTINNKRVCISMFNSSWRSWDTATDKGRILFGQAQIIDSKPYLDNADILIGVAHHDYSWFNVFERPNLPRILVSNYDMFFCGHNHGADTEMLCRPEGNTFMFTAPGLLQANLHKLDTDFKNGFMVVDFDKDRYHLSATKYYQDIDESFQIDRNYADSGVWHSEIPAGPLALMNKQVLDVYDTMFDNMPSLDTHLIGYSTSTHSPKRIEDIFVMPPLTYKDYSDNEFQPINTVTLESIDDLLSLKGNIVIHGMKESGKTILLDEIYIDILRNRRHEDAIPVLMDFFSIKVDLLARIASIWNERTSVAKDILEKKNVVLLIDDVDFFSVPNERLMKISEFLKMYPKVRLIATSQSRNGLPFENAEPTDIPFKSIKIESFKSDHIRLLACRWDGVDTENAQIRSRINYIIKAFSTFRIPCTPFSVTLLLWILEKGGECQPSNMALLMDAFITELLKDCNGDFTKDKFDQHNKKRLVANIAYSMLREEQECVLQGREYHYTFGSFVRQIEDHLEQMELKVFNARNLARELLSIGLFVHDESKSLIYFRFRCFMEYFLAIKMQMTEDVFTYVMEEKNYLDFSNELYYFTGLTRDKVSVVAKVFSRLESVFTPMVDAIDKNDKLDNFYGMIYVYSPDNFDINEYYGSEIRSGEWFSVHPGDDNYYRYYLDSSGQYYTTEKNTDTDTTTDTDTEDSDTPPDTNPDLFEWGKDDTGYYISAYTGTDTVITIPNEIEGHTITSIKRLYKDTNEQAKQLTKIYVSEVITTIGKMAFRDYTALEEIILPNSVTTIGNDAFYNCQNLRKITIPNGLKSIGSNAFYNCQSLNKITLPDGLTNIGSSAFYNCNNLTEITVPGGVNRISMAAFKNCSALISVTISDGVETIDDSAFSDCTSLTMVTIPESIKSINHHAFYKCTNLKDVYYGGSEEDWNTLLLSVGSDNPALTAGATIHFGREGAPKDFYVTEKEDGTLEIIKYNGNDSVMNIPSEIDGKTVTSIGSNILMHGDTTKDIVEIVIPETVTAIADNAFSLCQTLEKVTIPDSVTEIGKDVFTDYGNVRIYCSTDSAAHKYAQDNNIGFILTDGGYEPVKLGDVDGDGKISAKDSMTIQRYAINLKKLEPNQIRAADADGDGRVTNKDAIILLRYTINIPVKFAIGEMV